MENKCRVALQSPVASGHGEDRVIQLEMGVTSRHQPFSSSETQQRVASLQKDPHQTSPSSAGFGCPPRCGCCGWDAVGHPRGQSTSCELEEPRGGKSQDSAAN